MMARLRTFWRGVVLSWHQASLEALEHRHDRLIENQRHDREPGALHYYGYEIERVMAAKARVREKILNLRANAVNQQPQRGRSW